MWWNWSAGRFFQRSVIYRLGEAVFNGELNFQSRFCKSPKRCRSLSDEFLMRLRMRRNLVVLTCLYLILYPSFVSPLAAAFCNSIRKDFTLIYWSVSAYVRLCARVCDELYSIPLFWWKFITSMREKEYLRQFPRRCSMETEKERLLLFLCLFSAPVVNIKGISVEKYEYREKSITI